MVFVFFFFNDTATTEIYTLSLHDALPIFSVRRSSSLWIFFSSYFAIRSPISRISPPIFSMRVEGRSEEHTSELQSQSNLVCRLLLEKKNKSAVHRFPIARRRLISRPSSVT